MVRAVSAVDAERWAAMRARLWPDADAATLRSEVDAFFADVPPPTVAAVFVAGDGAAIGFLELSVRPYANGCDSMPVPFVEGWYVEPDFRGRGAGRALMCAAEAWAGERGYHELGSDTQIWNAASLRAHERCGFVETERVVYLRKML